MQIKVLTALFIFSLILLVTACPSAPGSSGSSSAASSSSSASMSSSSSSSITSTIVGTWLCTNSGWSTNNAGFTNEIVFSADNSFSVSSNGVTYFSGTYLFTGSNLTTYNQDFTSSLTDTNFSITFIDSGGYLYCASLPNDTSFGPPFELISGTGWNGTYESDGWDNSYTGQGGTTTNVFYTNFLILASTSANLSVVNQTNIVITNGTVYQKSGNIPPNGSSFPWQIAPTNYSFISANGNIIYYILDGSYMILNQTNLLSLCGFQYVRQ